LVQPGRILGAVMGLVILGALFALPFQEKPSKTLYQMASPYLGNINQIPSLGNPQQVVYAYILVASFILLTIAGLVGFFPYGAGVLGLVGIGLAAIHTYLYAPFLGLSVEMGLGFYVMLGASIVALAASFWHVEKTKKT
jgi:hypothetical protein